MFFSKEEVKQAEHTLQKNFPDTKVNNNKVIGDYEQARERKNIHYQKESMKRSHIINYIISNGIFENVAFVGSIFDTVDFNNCRMDGNGFVGCNFSKSSLSCSIHTCYSGNNFSQGTFVECNIKNITFKNTSFLNTLFQKTAIVDTTFEGCTLEGSKFSSTTLENVDLGNVNVEFIEFLNTSLKNVSLPFYQAAYVIGLADSLYRKEDVILKAENVAISREEYEKQIDNLIIYYYSEAEYFPICNLQIIKGDIVNARRNLVTGINVYIEKEDFRLIRYLCRLAQRYELLDEFTTQRILHIMEEYIYGKRSPISNISNCLLYYGEIRQMLLSGNSNSINLNIKVRTNVQKSDIMGVNYVNTLCNTLNERLSSINLGQTGFCVAVSNHSPFEIIIDVICGVAGIVAISDFVWKIIATVNNKSHSDFDFKKYNMIDSELLHKYTITSIDLCKQKLLNLKKDYSNKKMNQYIEDITQQLKTDIDSFYEKDIIIFKKKNDKE